MNFIFSPSPTSRQVYLLYPSNADAAGPVVGATKQLQKVSGNYTFSPTLHYKCCGRVSKKSSNVFVFTVLADTAQHNAPFGFDSERPKQEILLKHVIRTVHRLPQHWGITNIFRTFKLKDI